MATFYKLSIKDIKKETPHAVSIAFNIPNALKDKFKFVAGQYVTIKTTINNQEIRRAYSICTAPQTKEIRIVVKEIENGTFSVYANHNLKIGTVLEVSEPEGKFILVYGNKTIKDTIFYQNLNALKEKYSNQLKIQYVFSREQPEGALFGRIDTSVANYVLNQNKNATINETYLCGPEPMINLVKDNLKSKGFNPEQIHFELFTPSNEKEITTTSLKGKTSVSILLDDEKETFKMDKKETILDAALKHNLDVPYSCQGGICSSCIAKVTEGEATMDKNTILSKDEVAQGLILTCQAHPVTDKIAIDYDDV